MYLTERFPSSEAAIWRRYKKQVILKNLQNLQENTMVAVSFNKVTVVGPCSNIYDGVFC